MDLLENPNDLANALWLAANTRPCPRCQLPIEKDEGCNHMTCRKCRYDFCWICREPWKLHTQATGGYFQCNRFTDVEAAGGGGGGGFDADALGSSHADAQRARQRNKEMAQFIHHFSRYKVCIRLYTPSVHLLHTFCTASASLCTPSNTASTTPQTRLPHMLQGTCRQHGS